MSTAKGAVSTLGIRVLSITAQLGFFILVARSASLEVVGVFAIASACWVLGRALLPMGWNIAVLRTASVLRGTELQHQVGRLMRAATIETAILGVVAGSAFVFVGSSVLEANVATCVMAALVGILWAEISILVSYLRAYGRLLWGQFCEGLLVYFVPLLVVSICIFYGKRLDFMLIASSFFASGILALVCLLAIVVKFLASREEVVSTTQLSISTQRKLAYRLWWNQAFSAISSRASVLLAAPVAGVASTAIVEAGLRSQLVGQTLAWAGGTVASPRYAVAEHNNRSKDQGILNMVTWAALLPSVLVVAVLAVWGEPLLNILGEEFASERWTITLMALAAVFELPAASSGYFLMMTGRERTASLSTVIQLVVLVACAVLLGSSFGAFGIAWAVLIAALCRSAVVIYALQRAEVGHPLALQGLVALMKFMSGQLRLRT